MIAVRAVHSDLASHLAVFAVRSDLASHLAVLKRLAVFAALAVHSGPRSVLAAARPRGGDRRRSGRVELPVGSDCRGGWQAAGATTAAEVRVARSVDVAAYGAWVREAARQGLGEGR